MLNWAVSDNYFSVLGVRPYLGRFFSPGDDKTKDVGVLTYIGWKRLGADPAIIGKKVVGHTIIGVASADFTGTFYGLTGDVFTALSNARNDDAWFGKRDVRPLYLIARLKPNVSRRQAQAELTTLSAQIDMEVEELERRIAPEDILAPPDPI